MPLTEADCGCKVFDFDSKMLDSSKLVYIFGTNLSWDNLHLVGAGLYKQMGLTTTPIYTSPKTTSWMADIFQTNFVPETHYRHELDFQTTDLKLTDLRKIGLKASQIEGLTAIMSLTNTRPQVPVLTIVDQEGQTATITQAHARSIHSASTNFDTAVAHIRKNMGQNVVMGHIPMAVYQIMERTDQFDLTWHHTTLREMQNLWPAKSKVVCARALRQSITHTKPNGKPVDLVIKPDDIKLLFKITCQNIVDAVGANMHTNAAARETILAMTAIKTNQGNSDTLAAQIVRLAMYATISSLEQGYKVDPASIAVPSSLFGDFTQHADI